MNPRNPETRETRDDSPRSLRDAQITGLSQGRVLLKRGLTFNANMSTAQRLRSQLEPYMSRLEGKYSLSMFPTSVTITQDVELNILRPISLQGLSITGEIIENPATETVSSSPSASLDPQDPQVQELVQDRLEASSEVIQQSRDSRASMVEDLFGSITEIFASDKNFIEKLSAVLTLILNKLTGVESGSTQDSFSQTSQTSTETPEQATEAVRREFNLAQHQQSSVIDLITNPLPDKAYDLSTYLTYQAEGEAARKRLIIRPKSSTTQVPSGFDTKTLESFESDLTTADADRFRSSLLDQPLAIESKPNNPGFVSLVSVMQEFLNVDSSNTSKRTEIANNIRTQYTQESNPNSAIASKFLESFSTSG